MCTILREDCENFKYARLEQFGTVWTVCNGLDSLQRFGTVWTVCNGLERFGAVWKGLEFSLSLAVGCYHRDARFGKVWHELSGLQRFCKILGNVLISAGGWIFHRFAPKMCDFS